MRGSAVVVSSSLVAVIACNGLLDIQDRPLELADGGPAEAGQVNTGDAGLGETSAPDVATTEGGGPTISLYRKAVLDDKPSVYLRFGEASGTDAIDEMNPNAPGTYDSNGITLGVPGAIADPDTAAHFDGHTRITMKPGADFVGNAVFTVEAWVKHDTTTTGDEFLIDHEDVENMPRQGWYVTADLGGVVAGRWANDTSHGASSAGVPLSADQWHHIVATYDGQTERVFLDTKLGESNIVDMSLSATKNWSVGGINCLCSGNSIIGVIDELAIYPAVLTQQQIKAHYAASGREVPDGG